MPQQLNIKDMFTKNNFTKYALIIISWLIFVGLSIDAGGFLTNTVYTLFFNSDLAKRFWSQLDLSALYQFSESRFVMLTCVMTIAAILKAILFYQIIRMFYEKKLDISKPFSDKAKQYIQLCALISIGIGLFSAWGTGTIEALVKEGVTVPNVQNLKLGGADVWLFMGVILLVIADVFKKGIEIQTENDLTV